MDTIWINFKILETLLWFLWWKMFSCDGLFQWNLLINFLAENYVTISTVINLACVYTVYPHTYQIVLKIIKKKPAGQTRLVNMVNFGFPWLRGFKEVLNVNCCDSWVFFNHFWTVYNLWSKWSNVKIKKNIVLWTLFIILKNPKLF